MPCISDGGFSACHPLNQGRLWNAAWARYRGPGAVVYTLGTMADRGEKRRPQRRADPGAPRRITRQRAGSSEASYVP